MDLGRKTFYYLFGSQATILCTGAAIWQVLTKIVKAFGFYRQFDTSIQYKPYEENVEADALSRVESISIPVALNSVCMSAEQVPRNE